MNRESAVGVEVMRVVTSKIPALGSFYSAIIAELPNFFVNMKQVFDERREKILRYAHAY